MIWAKTEGKIEGELDTLQSEKRRTCRRANVYQIGKDVKLCLNLTWHKSANSRTVPPILKFPHFNDHRLPETRQPEGDWYLLLRRRWRHREQGRQRPLRGNLSEIEIWDWDALPSFLFVPSFAYFNFLPKFSPGFSLNSLVLWSYLFYGYFS